MKKISIVAPMYNEAETARAYIAKMVQVMESLKDFQYEIIAVDDGSRDNTLDILKEERMTYKKIGIVKFSRNYGLEGAVNAGLNAASGDAVIIMDSDLQDPPELVIQLVKMWQHGYEVVNARRKERPYDSFFKRFTASVYYKFVKKMSGNIDFEENVANYRLLSRKVVETIKSLPEVNTVFRVIVPNIGYKTATIEYLRDRRYAGVTKYSYAKLVKYAVDGITSAGIKPLRYIILIGIIELFICLIGIIAFGAMLFLKISNWWVVLLCTIVIFFSALQFIAIGIIGEYIGQIFIEVKHRPSYIIDEFMNPLD
ncbi:glycosyltransferase family 2 protein [Clostridium sp. AWRP]|uniref:glycosyltransferase family 2 protein n=1 Tax=Clostridium sp. AWRP TaxID=2212991 RepID=UPI000FDC8FA9|nr:glycosyltransferase family 2 protein [Clostridium sp. AWRP]AZV55406.1 glycosyltransferase [Clostridium sp. AWRP]